jgi:hypothetical protein
VKLDSSQKALKEKLLFLRRKIVAHTDEEEMHFNISIFSIDESDERLPLYPHLKIDEGLLLGEEEAISFRKLNRHINLTLFEFVMGLAKTNPELIEGYVKPKTPRAYQ